MSNKTHKDYVNWTISHEAESELRMHLLFHKDMPFINLRITQEDCKTQTEKHIDALLSWSDFLALADKLNIITERDCRAPREETESMEKLGIRPLGVLPRSGDQGAIV